MFPTQLNTPALSIVQIQQETIEALRALPCPNAHIGMTVYAPASDGYLRPGQLYRLYKTAQGELFADVTAPGWMIVLPAAALRFHAE